MEYLSRNKEPKLILVGAGPGDPDLISVKGMKALQEADVILFDALVHPKLLEYAHANCICQYVGKRAGQHSMAQRRNQSTDCFYGFFPWNGRTSKRGRSVYFWERA